MADRSRRDRPMRQARSEATRRRRRVRLRRRACRQGHASPLLYRSPLTPRLRPPRALVVVPFVDLGRARSFDEVQKESTMAEATIWGIHAGKTSDAESLFLKQNKIAI